MILFLQRIQINFYFFFEGGGFGGVSRGLESVNFFTNILSFDL